MTVPGPSEIEQAVNALRNGGVIAMPSDTLYALTAVASDTEAVRRVFAIKGREEGRALPLFVDGLVMAERIGVFDDHCRRLAHRFWPGPLTIVVAKQPAYESEALAGGVTVGLRVPDDETALAVIKGVGEPVTGTSANLAEGKPPDTPEEVKRQLGDRIDLVLDAGPCEIGIASTVVDCTGPEPRVLREGVVSREEIEAEVARTEGHSPLV